MAETQQDAVAQDEEEKQNARDLREDQRMDRARQDANYRKEGLEPVSSADIAAAQEKNPEQGTAAAGGIKAAQQLKDKNVKGAIGTLAKEGTTLGADIVKKAAWEIFWPGIPTFFPALGAILYLDFHLFMSAVGSKTFKMGALEAIAVVLVSLIFWGIILTVVVFIVLIAWAIFDPITFFQTVGFDFLGTAGY